MKIKDFVQMLARIEPQEEIYVTDKPNVHEKAGGIVIAEFQSLRETVDGKGVILSFMIMAGKQYEGIGAPVVFRLERPEWFGPPMDAPITKPGRIERFFWRLFGITKFGIPNLKEGTIRPPKCKRPKASYPQD